MPETTTTQSPTTTTQAPIATTTQQPTPTTTSTLAPTTTSTLAPTTTTQAPNQTSGGSENTAEPERRAAVKLFDENVERVKSLILQSAESAGVVIEKSDVTDWLVQVRTVLSVDPRIADEVNIPTFSKSKTVLQNLLQETSAYNRLSRFRADAIPDIVETALAGLLTKSPSE